MASKDSAVFKAGQDLSFLLSLPAPPLLGGDTEIKTIFHAHTDTHTQAQFLGEACAAVRRETWEKMQA